MAWKNIPVTRDKVVNSPLYRGLRLLDTLPTNIQKEPDKNVFKKKKSHHTLFETLLRTMEINELVTHKMNLYYTALYVHTIVCYSYFDVFRPLLSKTDSMEELCKWN